MPKRYLHLLNLDTVGGVEELFVNFLTYSASMCSLQHHLLITAKPPHPFFMGRLKSLAASQTLEKYLFGCKLIKCLRPFKRKRALKKARPDKIVLWNRIEPLDLFRKVCPSAEIVYYEHGASWMHPQDVETFEFFQKVDRFLVNSYAAKRMLQLKWNVTKPIEIIENPLKPTVIAASHPKTYKKGTPFTIGFIGRLIPLKGLPLLIHALKILIEKNYPVSLQIAGDGSLKSKFQELCKSCNISEKVTFLGCIHDVCSFYDAINLLAIPSIREPLGLVAQEAACRGCPVVATHIDGLAEVVIDGQTGSSITPTLDKSKYALFGGVLDRLPDVVYNPKTDALDLARLLDPEILADKIASIIDDPETYETMSENAIRFAKERPVFKTYSEHLLEALNK